MNHSNSINYLIENACPSIAFRVKHELMHESLSNEEMVILQTKVLHDPLVRKTIESQSEIGWFGPRFHGYESLESGLRILIEKGVTLNHDSMIRALDALERDTDLIAKDLGSFGKYFDQMRLGGARMIQAWLLASGGRCEHPLVEEQILVALEGMKTIVGLNSYDEATEIYTGKKVFKYGVNWPGIYHLRLLSLTHSWRSEENLKMVGYAIQKLVEFSPMPYTYVRKGSQLIAPASFAMLDFNTDLQKVDDAGWMMWFHRTELITRMGIAHKNKHISQQIKALQEMLCSNNQLFNLYLNHDYFKRWGAYTGLMLEPNWKKSANRINDLTFRSQLILHQFLTYKEK